MKEKLLLTYYLQQDRIIPVQEIASDFRISQRKAHMLIQDFNYFSRKNGCLLQSRTNLGYELLVTNQQKMTELLAKPVKVLSYLNPNHRRLLMQIYLVTQIDFVSVGELSEYSGASKSTVTTDLKVLAPKMAAFQLGIVGKTYYGMEVIGSELNKRLCLIKALNLLPVPELHHEMAAFKVEPAFRSAVRQLFNDHHVVLTEKVFLTIVQYMVIMAQRVKEHQLLSYQQILEAPKLTSVREPLVELMHVWYEINVPKVEMNYLIDYLSDQLISFQEHEKCYEVYTRTGLELISQSLGLEGVGEELFCQNLSKHLLNLKARMTYGTQILFPQRKKYYQENFFELFVTQVFLQEMTAEVDFTKMTIDEVLYVSLYFKSWLLRAESPFDYYAKKTIVMAESRSVGYLLKTKLQELYPSMAVTIFDDIDLSAIRERIKAYDLAITSKTISREERQAYPSIMEVTDYLSAEEQRRLKQKIKELFEWPELAKLLHVENYHYYQKKLESLSEVVYQKEALPLIIVENFLAMVFKIKEHPKKIGLRIEQFNHPQIVRDKKVSLIVTLSITKNELREAKEFCQLFQKVSQSPQFQRQLLDCCDFEDFKACIRRIYLES